MALGLLASFTRSQGQRVSQIADALLAAFFASNARVGRQPAKLLKSRNFLRTHSLSIKPCGETLFFLFLYFSLDLKASLCFVLFSFVPPSKLGRFCSFSHSPSRFVVVVNAFAIYSLCCAALLIWRASSSVSVCAIACFPVKRW